MSDWKIDWKQWSLGGKLIFVASCIALISLPMKWKFHSLGSKTGIVPGIFFLCLYIYPLQAILRKHRLNKVLGIICCSAALINTLIYIKLVDKHGIFAGDGVFLFLYATIGLLVGVIIHR